MTARRLALFLVALICLGATPFPSTPGGGGGGTGEALRKAGETEDYWKIDVSGNILGSSGLPTSATPNVQFDAAGNMTIDGTLTELGGNGGTRRNFAFIVENGGTLNDDTNDYCMPVIGLQGGAANWADSNFFSQATWKIHTLDPRNNISISRVTVYGRGNSSGDFDLQFYACDSGDGNATVIECDALGSAFSIANANGAFDHQYDNVVPSVALGGKMMLALCSENTARNLSANNNIQMRVDLDLTN